MPITVGPFCLTHPVNFPCGRKPEYPEETHDFRQSVDFYSFHMRTGFESHWESSHWDLNLRPQRWKASALTTWPPKLLVPCWSLTPDGFTFCCIITHYNLPSIFVGNLRIRLRGASQLVGSWTRGRYLYVQITHEWHNTLGGETHFSSKYTGWVGMNYQLRWSVHLQWVPSQQPTKHLLF
jgi:hypothetical protein